jgi:hypothetical protein
MHPLAYLAQQRAAETPWEIPPPPPDARPPVPVRAMVGAPGEEVTTASPWPLQFEGTSAQAQSAIAQDIDPSIHEWARGVLQRAWAMVHPNETPSLQELQAAGAIAILESGYGRWWKSPCNTARNWGAVQCSKLPTDGVCPCEGCLYEDSIPQSDGSSKKYAVCFRAYASDEEGAADLIKHITSHRPKTREALKTGDAEKISAAMYDERYYGGFGATREQRIEGHVKALTTRAKEISKGLGEPLVVVRGGSAPVGGDGAEEGDSPLVLGAKVIAGAAAGVTFVLLGKAAWKKWGGRRAALCCCGDTRRSLSPCPTTAAFSPAAPSMTSGMRWTATRTTTTRTSCSTRAKGSATRTTGSATTRKGFSTVPAMFSLSGCAK